MSEDSPSGGSQIPGRKEMRSIWRMIGAGGTLLVAVGGVSLGGTAHSRASDHDSHLATHDEAIANLQKENAELKAALIRMDDHLGHLADKVDDVRTLLLERTH